MFVGNGLLASLRSISNVRLFRLLRGGLGTGRPEFLYAAFTDSHLTANAAWASSLDMQEGPETYGSRIRAVNQTRPSRTDSKISTAKPPIRFALFN